MGAKSVRKVEIAAIFARKVAIGAILGPVPGGGGGGEKRQTGSGLGARARARAGGSGIASFQL